MNCTRSLPLFALPPDECRKSDCLGECEGGVVDGRERSGMVAGVAKGGVERWGLPDPDPENGMARPNGEGGVNFAPYTLRMRNVLHLRKSCEFLVGSYPGAITHS